MVARLGQARTRIYLINHGKGAKVAKALGQLENAPLIYVLAQIRFTRVPHMDRRWEDFHEKIFESYPQAETDRLEQVAIKDGQPSVGDTITRWRMTNETQQTGIIMDAGMLVFHTTDYKTSDVFLADLENVLRALADTLPAGVSLARLGLRYVDLLTPEQGLDVDGQVMETFRLPNRPAIGDVQRVEQIVTYETSAGGTMVIRHRQSLSPDLLPGDIFPNNLEAAPRLNREREEGTFAGVLDYDHFVELQDAFDVDTIITWFRKLHDALSIAFKETTTKDAQKLWQKEG